MARRHLCLGGPRLGGGHHLEGHIGESHWGGAGESNNPPHQTTTPAPCQSPFTKIKMIKSVGRPFRITENEKFQTGVVPGGPENENGEYLGGHGGYCQTVLVAFRSILGALRRKQKARLRTPETRFLASLRGPQWGLVCGPLAPVANQPAPHVSAGLYKNKSLHR